MGKNILIVSLLIIFLTNIAGCGPSGLIRQAVQFEEAGLYRDASETYIRLFQRHSSNPEVRMGLQRSGQMYIDQQAELVRQHHSSGDYKAAVYSHTEARDFFRRLSNMGITLLANETAESLFADSKENYLSNLYSRGQVLIGNNRYGEAKTLFLEITKFDPDYGDSRSYLERATYEPLFQEGLRLYNEGRYMQAYRQWKEIADQNPDYRQITVNLNQALNERYKQGALMLSEENFTQAANALREVFMADRNFRDVQQLLTQAVNEPIYRRGVAQLISGQCRMAYFTFKGLIDDVVYRDSDVQLQHAHECARFPVAVATVRIHGHQSKASQFQALILGELIKLNDPFLQVFELSALDPRADRAIVSSQSQIQQAALKSLAESHEIDALLQVNISRFEVLAGEPRKISRKGFARKPLPRTEGTPAFADTLVDYEEIWQRNIVRMNVEYKLISTADARILLANQFSEERSSTMHYAVYTGELPLLFPAIETNNGMVADHNNRDALQKLLNAPKSIRNTARLTEELFSILTSQLAAQVVRYNPEQ